MGGGKGGGGTSTQYSGVNIPPEVLARYSKATDRAETTSQQPWQNYTGSFVAPVNETQQAGYGTMMAGQGYTQAGWEAPNAALQQGVSTAAPYLNQAGGQYNQALAQGQQGTQNALSTGQQAFSSAAPLTSGALAGAQPYNQAATGLAAAGMQTVDPSQLNLQQFMNPYQQDVIQATMGQLGQQQAQQRMDQRGNMIKEGTFGGDRSGIANANLVNQQNLATGSVLSGLNQGNFQQALGAAQQQQGVGLGAAQANRAALQQGANQMLGIGQQGYQQGMGAGQQAYQQGMGLAGLQGQMGQQGFAQGLSGGQALQGLGTAGYGMYSDAAARQAALAGQAFGQNMQTAQGQTGFGTLQQQTQQAQDSAVYNQWLQERGYPFQTSQFYTNAVMGTGPLSGSTAYSGSFSPQPFFSDERVKDDITEIGKTHDGIPIIRFRYKGDSTPQIGLSAQDVEKRHPDAVGRTPEGIKTVDYLAATDHAARPHAAAGGGMGPGGGGDPFSGGFAGLAQTANIGAGAGKGFGSLPNIVALQKASLAGNAPAGIRAPATAGMAGPGMQGPGNPPPAPAAAPGSGLSPAVAALVAATATPAPLPFQDLGGDGGDGGSSGVGGGGDTGGGDGASSSDGSGSTYAEGGRAGFAGYGSGQVEGEEGLGGLGGGLIGGGGLSDILKAQLAMYGSAPWAKNPQGTGNAGILNIAPAKASQMVKPPEMRAPAAAKSVADEAGEGVDKALKTGKGIGELYDTGKDALVGSAEQGKPGEKGYKKASGGLFGSGGKWDYDKGWWHENLGTDSWGSSGASAGDGVSFVSGDSYGGSEGYANTLPGFYERGGAVAGLGRAGFRPGGAIAPYNETSVLDPELFEEKEASDLLQPPDPAGKKEAGKGGDGGKGAIKSGVTAAASLAGMATGMPWLGPVAGLMGSFFAKGGRAYAEGGEVNDNEPEPGLAPAAEAIAPEAMHYGIFSRSQGHKMVGRATDKYRARRIRDKRDNAYGAYDHFIKPIPASRKRWAGGRAGFAGIEDSSAVLEPETDELEVLRRAEREKMAAAIEAGRMRASADPEPGLKIASLTPTGSTASDAPPARPGGFSEAVQLAQAGASPPAVTGPAVAKPPEPDPLAGSVNSATAPALPPPPPPPAPTERPPVPQQASPTTQGGNSFNIGNVKTFDGKGGYQAPPTFDDGVALTVHNASTYPAKYNQGQPMTIAQIGARWAPPSDPNDAQGLNKNWPVNVAKAYQQAGFDPSQPVNFNDPQQAAAFARAVHIAEYGEGSALDIKAYLPGAQRAGDPSIRAGFPSMGVGGAKTGTASGSPNDPVGLPPPSGLGSASNAKSMFGDSDGWVDRNERYIVPGLSFLGAMLSSPSRTLAGSIGSGLVAGAGQYATLGQRQQQLDISKQTQNISQAGKMFEAADRIARDRAGFMQSRPGQSTKGYDDAYAAITGKAYQLMAGVPGMGMRPADAAEWAKTQSPEVQAFHNQVVPEDDPFYLSSIAAGPVDQATRTHYEGLAKAAADKAMKGLSRGRNGGSVMLSPALTQAWLDRERQASQANSTGAAQTPDAAIKRVQDEAASLLAQHRADHPDRLPPAVKAQYDALMARIEELRRTARPPSGGMKAGGRVGRAFGGLLYGLPPDDESAVAPAVASDADLMGDNVQQAQLEGGPGAPPPPSRSITKPAAPAAGEPAAAPPPSQFDRNDPKALDNHANALRAMGNHAAAADYESRAAELRERYRASGLQTKTVDGVETTAPTPGARETAQKNWQQAQNQKTLQMAQEQSINAEALQQELAKYKSTLFDEAGKQKSTMGPITTVLAPLAAWGHQLGLSDEIVKDTIGLSSTDIEVSTKSKLALAQQMAAASMGNKQTEGLFNQLLNSGIAGPQMSAAAASMIIDHIYIPKARFDAKLYDHLKKGNIYDDDYWSLRQDYYRDNKMYPPAPPAPAKPAETGAPGVPSSLSGIQGLEYSPSTGNYRDPATKRVYDRTGKPVGGP